MSVITEFFEDDHRRLDRLFEQFQAANDHAKQTLFNEFQLGLLKHIDWEENLLFPAVEQAAGFPAQAGPTHVMRIEHEQIKQCLALIANMLAEHKNSSVVEARLLDILAEHNVKEERILYPTSDNTIAKPDAEALIMACR